MFIKIIEADTGTVHMFEGQYVRWTQTEIIATPAAEDGRKSIGRFTCDKEHGLYMDISDKERTYEWLTVVASSVFIMSDKGQTIDRWHPRSMIMSSGN